LRIAGFDSGTQGAVAGAVQDLRQQAGSKLIGSILDLRNNPGGSFAGSFDAGVAVVYADQVERDYATFPVAVCNGLIRTKTSGSLVETVIA
jgi:hypothetical protein